MKLYDLQKWISCESAYDKHYESDKLYMSEAAANAASNKDHLPGRYTAPATEISAPTMPAARPGRCRSRGTSIARKVAGMTMSIPHASGSPNLPPTTAPNSVDTLQVK